MLRFTKSRPKATSALELSICKGLLLYCSSLRSNLGLAVLIKNSLADISHSTDYF